MTEIIEFKKFAAHLANLSGSIIKKYFRTDISIETKSDNSPVTIADKRAEEAIRERIMSEFPNHGILGEEFGNHNESAQYKWVLDPIDGTKSFITGIATFGTLIGLLKDGIPILGLFHQPIIGELLIGDNELTELNGKRTKIRSCEKIEEAILLTSDHFMIGNYKNQTVFDQLANKAKLYRTWGDCFGYYLLCTGYADIMVDPIMSPWDALPLIPIIKGAGGTVTDYEGNNPVYGTSIIATASGIHSQVVEILNKN
ncbi:MAG: histidinol-phosphatase [Ignavibacterium sp.]|nr:MAG: histidinol-phosphatase [Ignavibacterium sp.]